MAILNNESMRLYIKPLFFLGSEAESGSLDELADYISPSEEASCHCQDERCTGSRVIFASLLLMGREELVRSFHILSFCDSKLPPQGRTPDSDSTSTRSAQISYPHEFERLMDIEKELFHHIQWQMRAPYIERIGGRERHEVLNENVSLPWTKLVEADPIDGQISRVVEIAIDDNHHNLVRCCLPLSS